MNLQIGRPAPKSPETASPQSANFAHSGSPGAHRTDRRVLLNTSALAGSSLWRIGISFVLQILIANRLGEVGLGQYATALAYLNVAQILSGLGLPMLLVRDLARTPAKRRRYFRAALLVQFLAALLVWAGLIGLTLILPYQPITRLTLIVIGGSLPLFAVTSACETMFQAGERMELVMGVEMTINTLIVASSILILWRGGTVVHLAGVLIGTQTISALLCLFLLGRSGLLETTEQASERRNQGPNIWLLMRRSAPFYGLALANVLLQRLDILLLSVLAGEAVTGIYSAAYLMVRVLIILSQTYWQSLYPTFSRLRHQAHGQYRRLAAMSLRYGLMLLLPVAAVSTGTAGSLLALIYSGETYRASVAVFQVLIWAAPLFMISTYAVNLLLVERLPARSLLIVGIHLGTLVLLLPLLAGQWQALGAAMAMTLSIALSAVTGLVLVHKARAPLAEGRHIPALTAATGLALLAAYYLPLPWPVRLVVGGLLYGSIILWRGVLSTADLQLFRKALQR